MSKLPLLALAAVLSAPQLFAQHRMMASGARSAPPAPSVPFPGTRTNVGITGRFHVHRPFRQGPFYPYGLYPGYYSYPYDYGFGYDSYEAPPPSSPQPVSQSGPAAEIKQEPPPAPVLLELKGDQWVKVENFTAAAAAPSTAIAMPKAAEIPPAILVYRDGRTEEVSSYSIIGPVIYTKANYWVNGTWTRTIQIADLDLSATMKQNQQRGVKFELPSGPDEVMIRP